MEASAVSRESAHIVAVSVITAQWSNRMVLGEMRTMDRLTKELVGFVRSGRLGGADRRADIGRAGHAFTSVHLKAALAVMGGVTSPVVPSV